MQLNRIAQRLRDRDWTSVAVELVIVVAGVFIALQVSNWNDARRDSARGEEYLRRMHAELLKDVDSIAKISVFWNQVHANGIAAVAYAEDGTLYRGSAWKTVLAYYQASQVWPYRKPDNTFQEILSSGEMALIRNATLRTRISDHYDNGAGSQVVEVLGLIPAYREDVRGMTPLKIQQYIWKHCYNGSSSGGQQLLDCPSPISEAEAQAVLVQYRQSPRLTNGLRFWMVNVGTGLMLMRTIASEAESLAQDINGELAR